MRIININQNLFHTNMANNQQELQRLLNIIPVGRANAMHAEDIARGMWYPSLSSYSSGAGRGTLI